MHTPQAQRQAHSGRRIDTGTVHPKPCVNTYVLNPMDTKTQAQHAHTAAQRQEAQAKAHTRMPAWGYMLYMHTHTHKHMYTQTHAQTYVHTRARARTHAHAHINRYIKHLQARTRMPARGRAVDRTDQVHVAATLRHRRQHVHRHFGVRAAGRRDGQTDRTEGRRRRGDASKSAQEAGREW